MYMEQWENGCLTILLTDRELSGMGLSFGKMDGQEPAAREALNTLLTAARRQAGLPPEHRLQVEALPVASGCLLLVTPLPRRRSIRIRRSAKPQIYRVDSADALLALAAGTASLPPLLASSLYRWKNGWRLVVYPLRVSPRWHNALSEFGEWVGEGETAVAVLEEHGIPLAVGDALDRLTQVVTSK